VTRQLAAGDVVRIETPGGGGFGDPEGRDGGL
jgi:N-methylhydantoinase B/oxoprolinase/acetone carboxylase alpha subunit